MAAQVSSSVDQSGQDYDPVIRSELLNLEAAFKQEFVGQAHVLLKTMDHYKKASNYYNRSFTISQSSGTGKSRLVDQAAQLRFTFLFNLHEDLPQNSGAFPPFDANVRDYLRYNGSDNAWVHSVFLETLFNETVVKLQDYNNGSPSTIAKRWYDWMRVGSSPTSVGTNRTAFYDRVIKKAAEKEKLYANAYQRLCTAARSLTERLRELCTEGYDETMLLATVCFDEAYTLRHESLSQNDPYFFLMRVLSGIREEDIFFVFVSTDPNLQAFGPADEYHYPSFQVPAEYQAIPPYFELHFDLYCAGFTGTLKQAGKLTLRGVTELEQVVKFGRPLWNSYYQSLDPDYKNLTMDLAKLKLNSMSFGQDQDAQLAALDCRVLIPYDLFSVNSRNTQARLVKLYMRVVYDFPKDQHYIWSGYSSEPILAEAAAQLLTQIPELGGITECAPNILARALDGDLLSRGEQGQLVVRTLLTVAHDVAILRYYPRPDQDLLFHRPLPVLELLKSLVTDDCWNIIRTALPVRGSSEGSKTLEEAFKDAWTCFSHFATLGDLKSFTLSFLSELLKRGAAAQASDNKPFWSFALPMLFGDPGTTIISQENASLLLGRLTDRQDVPQEQVFSNTKLPVISIQYELEVENPDERVRVHTVSKDNHPLHYAFTLYGCTPATYACIPEGNNVYTKLLRLARIRNRRNLDLDLDFVLFAATDDALMMPDEPVFTRRG